MLSEEKQHLTEKQNSSEDNIVLKSNSRKIEKYDLRIKQQPKRNQHQITWTLNLMYQNGNQNYDHFEHYEHHNQLGDLQYKIHQLWFIKSEYTQMDNQHIITKLFNFCILRRIVLL